MKKYALTLAAASALLITSVGAIAQPATNAASPAAATTSPAISTTAPVRAAAPALSGQHADPTQAGRYTGPSSAALSTVKQLLANGKDDQYASLQGRIVSHDQGKNYTFADASGSMSVEISPKRFPQGQAVSAEQRVELSGKLDKGWNKTEFEVKEMRLLP